MRGDPHTPWGSPPGQAVILRVLHNRKFQAIIEFYKGIPFISAFKLVFVLGVTRGDPPAPRSKSKIISGHYFLFKHIIEKFSTLWEPPSAPSMPRNVLLFWVSDRILNNAA